MPSQVLGGFPAGGATGKTSAPAQAPIRGLQRAFQPTDPAQLMLPDEGEDAPDRSGLGQRQPNMAMNGLLDVMRRFGRVY